MPVGLTHFSPLPDELESDDVGPALVEPDSDPDDQLEPEAPESSRTWRIISWVLTLGVIALIVLLWPARFGGSTSFTIVSGTSMEPTYFTGDFIVARTGGYEVGEVLIYQIPEGDPGEGHLVVHRLEEILDDGQMIFLGDNKDHVDPWHITEEDVVGRAVAHFPGVGRFFTSNLVWFVLAALLGVSVAIAIWPAPPAAKADDDAEESDEAGSEPDVDEPEELHPVTSAG